MDTLTKTAVVLANIGAINWGLVAMNFNLVEWLANLVTLPALATIIYALVGISGVYCLAKLFMSKAKKK
jgi:uncharacterized membrane protein YuzA (DUF378 family)